MPRSFVSKSILTATIVSTLLFSSGNALASCLNTEWKNVNPDHPIPTITTRLCNQDVSINVVGAAPDGSTFDFGWSPAVQVNPDSYKSSFVDANASNEILLEINREANTMRLTIDTILNGDSNVTQWFADYTLASEYD